MIQLLQEISGNYLADLGYVLSWMKLDYQDGGVHSIRELAVCWASVQQRNIAATFPSLQI